MALPEHRCAVPVDFDKRALRPVDFSSFDTATSNRRFQGFRDKSQSAAAQGAPFPRLGTTVLFSQWSPLHQFTSCLPMSLSFCYFLIPLTRLSNRSAPRRNAAAANIWPPHN
jgi:hypothetical protein